MIDPRPPENMREGAQPSRNNWFSPLGDWRIVTAEHQDDVAADS